MAANADAMATGRNIDDLLRIVDDIGQTVVEKYADDVDKAARFPTEAFNAMKQARLLSCYVPAEFGGDGLTITEVCRICEKLGQYDASVAMIFAMHQIQVACLVHHGTELPFFYGYLKQLSEDQLVLASATTEIGVGGDVRSSVCAVEVSDGRFTLEKKAPVISYALNSDAILVTCRSSAEARGDEQSIVLVKNDDHELERICDWDTLGFRGTCSEGFILKSSGSADQIMPTPYADILAKTMHPVSHLVWGSLWTGLAYRAVDTARQSVREAARKQGTVAPITSLRLSEVNEVFFSMRSGLHAAIDEYQEILNAGDDEAFSGFGFTIKINNVKIRCSELVVDVVGKALQIVGINGYKNNSDKSLSRHLRDAYGAALMVNNDRIRGHNSTMQVAYKGQ